MTLKLADIGLQIKLKEEEAPNPTKTTESRSKLSEQLETIKAYLKEANESSKHNLAKSEELKEV